MDNCKTASIQRFSFFSLMLFFLLSFNYPSVKML